MALKYTPEETYKLSEAVLITGFAVSIVEAGIISTAIEAVALAKEVNGAAQKYPDNNIIQGLFSSEKSTRDNITKVKINPEEMKPEIAVDSAITKINEALSILNAKNTPEEVQEFKEFLYHTAEVVANAAGSGIFGTGTPKVSEEEAAALVKLKAALGV